jgi:hypothetical protein
MSEVDRVVEEEEEEVEGDIYIDKKSKLHNYMKEIVKNAN